jgi:cobalt/nickel transport system ATP-binding protein
VDVVTKPALELARLTVRYPGAARDALKEISLTLERGEGVALVGPNGSGKTSLLSAIVGLVPYAGDIVVDGVPVERRRLEEVRRKVGFLFSVADDQILFPRVFDDVLFGLRRSGLEREEAEVRALRVLEQLGIADLARASAHHLSLGQRKRVALAGTLVLEPTLLLLDEPSAGLDPRGKVELAAALEDLDGAILLATHDLAFACRTCRRGVVLRGGEVVGDISLDGGNVEAISQKLLEAMYPEGLDRPWS